MSKENQLPKQCQSCDFQISNECAAKKALRIVSPTLTEKDVAIDEKTPSNNVEQYKGLQTMIALQEDVFPILARYQKIEDNDKKKIEVFEGRERTKEIWQDHLDENFAFRGELQKEQFEFLKGEVQRLSEKYSEDKSVKETLAKINEEIPKYEGTVSAGSNFVHRISYLFRGLGDNYRTKVSLNTAVCIQEREE